MKRTDPAKGHGMSIRHRFRHDLLVAFVLLLCHPALSQKYQTIGPGSCGLDQTKCHATENNWYRNDPHKTSLDKLADDPEKAEKYADLAGIGAPNMYKGNSVCMSCHGTQVSGKETKEVEEGVSCESCHGPGSGYKDPHQEGKGGGAGRPGYVKGVDTGMKDFKRKKDEVANACVRCHYVTDQKTLAAGHSTGANFGYISGLKKVAGYPNHWKRQPGEEDLVKGRFEDAKKRKSPGGVVVVAKQTPVPKPGTDESTDTQVDPRPVRRPPPPPLPPAPDLMAMPVSVGPIDLPPFPTVTDSTALDSLLLVLKHRLELLYQKTR
jgi:hypothetical protein